MSEYNENRTNRWRKTSKSTYAISVLVLFLFFKCYTTGWMDYLHSFILVFGYAVKCNEARIPFGR